MKDARIAFYSVLIAAVLVAGCQSPSGTGSGQPATPAPTAGVAAPQPSEAGAVSAPAGAPESKAAESPTDPTMSILDMQKRLTELGYKPGPSDGKPGQRTTNALKKFQREHKLPATGTLDVETIRALEKR